VYPISRAGTGRQPLAEDLTREPIVHDLPEAKKHCDCCGKDLRLIAKEASEPYEDIPASIKSSRTLIK
jgi:transposase